MQILTGLMILILSCIGHSELWVIVVNRFYGMRIRHSRLRALRHVHDFCVLLYPPCLLIGSLISEQGLLRGGTFDQQPAFLQMWIVGTLVGLIPFTLGVIRWHLIQKKSFFRKDSAQHYHLKAEAQRRPELGEIEGPRRHFAKSLPFSETFQLEVNRKSIPLAIRAEQTTEIDGRPAAKELRILHLSDLHFIGCPGEGFYKFVVEKALEQNADLCVFAGDLIDEPAMIPDAVRLLKPLTEAMPCFFVLGNHDWRYDPEEIRSAMVAGGWHVLGQNPKHLNIRGWKLHLEGSELPWMGDRYTNPRDDLHTPFPQSSNEQPRPVRILVSHTPDQHGFAVRKGFDLMLTGHTHGGQILLPLIGPVYSPSIYGVRYASGLFEIGNLFLHVSRGIAGKDPLRWRCPPELTCLHLISGSFGN